MDRRAWQVTWGCKQLDMIERLHFHFSHCKIHRHKISGIIPWINWKAMYYQYAASILRIQVKYMYYWNKKLLFQKHLTLVLLGQHLLPSVQNHRPKRWMNMSRTSIKRIISQMQMLIQHWSSLTMGRFWREAPLICLGQWFWTLDDFFPLNGHLTMSGNLFGCHSFGTLLEFSE